MFLTASPPGQTRNDPCREPPSRRSRVSGRCFLTIRWLVTHESHTRVGWSGSALSGPLSIARKEGEWQSPLQYSRENGFARREVARAVSKNPYGSHERLGTGRRVARRWAG